MLLNYSFQATRYIPRPLPKVLATALTAAVLASCGADVSDETAMQDSMEVSLAQCEILQYGVVGTPTEPVVVDGEEVNACLLSTSFGELENTRSISDNLNMIQLKTSWNYEPLVWVLDGVYQLGESKQYQTLDELVADHKAFQLGSSSSTVYAKEGTVVIVHRNAQLSASIQSLDDNLVGGGEWGGIIINGIGSAPECPQTASPEALCNIEGPFGYYGGVSPSTDLVTYGLGFNTNTSQGLPGLYTLGSGTSSVIGEAGAETQVTLEGYEGGTIHSAVTAYAPVAGQVGNVIAYSGNTAITAYGGSWNLFTDTFTGSVPTPYITESASTAVELNEYQGGFAARVSHSNSTAAIILNGGEVDLINTTLYDQYNQAGSALALTGASMLSIDDVVIQGFDTCLAPQDSASQTSIGSALLNCSNITNSTDNALAAIADATDLITGADPLLSYIWAVTNDSLSFANVEDISQLGAGNVGVSSNDLYSAAILFPECMDVGTLASDTVQIDNLTYQICDLNPTVAQSATLYSNFSIEGRLDNGGSPDYYPKNIAWRIDGQVQVGTDFTSLSSSEQAAALASPIQLTLASSTKLVATSNNDSELVIQPDARLRVAGSSTAGVEVGAVGLGAGDITSSWRGISVNGHSDADYQVDIHYLRLFDTGEDGQAALTLNEVDDNSQIAYLDIYGAGADGLNINGGAVNFDHLVMANIAGDQIQWQNGYTGTIETAIVSPGDDSTGHVLHGINDSTNYDASPRSRPVITNITAAGFGSANTAVLLEQGSGLLMFNSVFSDFATCLDIDDAETAALQSSDPQGILFDGVIFSCENILAADSEDSGYDYGYTVASSSGVYEEDPVLDTSYVITGDTLAGQASLSSYAGLIGDSYSQLNDAGYIGAVSDSNDNWYNNWSDSVVITPDFECNNLGILTALDSELTAGAYRFGYDTNGDGEISSNEYWYPASKSCRILGGIYTNNVTISQYTGLPGETVEQWLNDGYTLEEIQVDALTGGWAINSSTGETRYIEEAVMRVAPTHWSIKGIVHIGNGHQEITDVDTVAEMKANPVMLTIEAGTELTSENDKSVLHISRAGSLVMIGDPDYSENTYDPENSRGLLNISGIRFVIDGFGRHNQCPNAETTDAGGQVCNIDGEYGYYGGYDNSHSNVDIQYVSFNDNTFLDFNAVGNGLIAHVNIYESSRQSEVRYAININGGSLNIKDIYFDLSAFPEPRSYQGLIEWNYGYTGNIQYLNGIVWIYLPSDEYGNSAVIKGRNNPDNPDSLPRSAPTMANISLYQLPVDGTTFQGGQPGTMMLALYNGSSVNLYNSVLGAEFIYMSYYGGTVEQCIGFDDQASSVTAEDINIVNLAAGCENVSFDSRVIENPTYKSSATYTFGVNFDSPNLLSQVAQKAFGVFNLNPVLVGRDFAEFPMLEVVNQGNEKGTNSGNYNESPTADTEFLEQTDYMGMYNYNQNPELIYYLE
ncbi:hypothetical protein [Oceanobacter sp. 4_MG-2023]|uniref:hypothetical protein n=1 Tax=Oceanobacter sp. 4_MG-2023 TaxID=3062623 RepID=UPI0027345D1D|nr:hypothetical protein [Oceanobacter sp. 4_MG-2023]MDP2548714.1 hypothetical protein [Oceanobacter sp. 4_MG-2023]